MFLNSEICLMFLYLGHFLFCFVLYFIGLIKGEIVSFSLQKNVMEFLAPLKPVAIRIVRNAHGNKTGKVQGIAGRGALEGWLVKMK